MSRTISTSASGEEPKPVTADELWANFERSRRKHDTADGRAAVHPT
jgi:hypothetical protein